MTLEFYGHLAALSTSFCWAISAITFESAGTRIGSMPVNLIRLLVSLGFFAIWGFFVRGQLLPFDAGWHAWAWLGLSGIIGFTLGDLCLFRAFLLLGARLSSLIMATAPAFTALLGWAFLEEGLSPNDLLGIFLVTLGIVIAIWRRTSAEGATLRPAPANHSGTTLWKGVLLGLGGALGQALGLVVSKYGMGSYDPIAATQIRVVVGTAGFVLLFSFLGIWPRVWAGLKDARAMRTLSIGAFFGPFVGVSLSLFAVQNSKTGVAATLMALTPLIIIPLSHYRGKEKVSLRALVGALLAVAGSYFFFT